VISSHGLDGGFFGGVAASAKQRLQLQSLLSRMLEADSGEDNLKRRLDIPDGLLEIVASHVLQEAEEEPYGLKGELNETCSVLEIMENRTYLLAIIGFCFEL
jgi:hypothetical protein